MLRASVVTRAPAGSRRPRGSAAPQRRLVEEEPVLGLSVFSEAFAVIGGHHNQRSAADAKPIEAGQQPPEHCVCVRHLSVVGVSAEPRGLGRRRV